MTKTTSTVEINGNYYDAVTGQLIKTIRTATSKLPKAPAGLNVDGFMKKQPMKTTAGQIKKAGVSISRMPAKVPKTVKSGHATAKQTAQNIHKRTQHSKTLMRGVVSKTKLAPKATSAHKNSVYATAFNPGRVWRANRIAKNSKVRHFGKPAETATADRIDKKPVKTIKATPKAMAASPAQATVAAPLPSMITSVSHQQLERMLDHALLKADAHKQAVLNKKNRLGPIGRLPRWLSVGVSSLVILVIASFFIWQNVPQLSMKLAARKAHVNASIPSYIPSGFSFEGPIVTKQGKVTAQFKSNSDSSLKFSVTQEASNQNSESLIANTVPKDEQLQTMQDNGVSVYMYGKDSISKATCVNHGKQSTVDNAAHLNPDQLAKIAQGVC